MKTISPSGHVGLSPWSLKLWAILTLLAISGRLFGQAYGPTTDANRRIATAQRTETPPRLDGELDDACWQNAQILTDFVTNSPVYGRPAALRSDVRIVYTDEAVYIGAYLYQPRDKIRTDLGQRDAFGTADELHIGFDTYRDRQNAFRFQVTAGNVQLDARMSPFDFDVSWDAVWNSEVKLHADGWSVEIRIPFSALRFPQNDRQTWGIQIARQIRYLNEFSTWSPVDPNGGGAMPQWGDINGLDQLNPPLRLAFSPYVAASVQRSPVSDDPVEYATARSISGGMDVKWGLSESFTLDATLVPNFGEVQSDNIIRNLSPFEVQYEERRQFFTEGTELFNKGGIFYSRRIGGRPPGFFSVPSLADSSEIIHKNPAQQSLYNATKLSGRTRSKLGIGLLNAVAAPANAVLRNEETGAERRIKTAPLTNYNVLVIDQLLPNNSAVALSNTNVMREGPDRDANVSVLTFNLRDKKNRYEVFGDGRLSAVWGQPGARALTGSGYSLGVAKVSGAFTWAAVHSAADDRYDPSDMGLFQRNNYQRQFARISYGDYQPKGNRLYTYADLGVENTFLNFPRRWEALELFGYVETLTKKQRQFGLSFSSRPLWYYDYFEPRVFGKKFYHAPYGFVSPRFTTDQRKKFFCTFSLSFGESPIPRDPYIGLSVSPTWVLSDHLRLGADINLAKDHSNFGAVNWDNPDDIIFGRRNITTFNNEISGQYLFGPRMNLSVRARHYWAKLYYQQYLHLNDDGTFSPSDWQGTADENFNLFNIDLVYTWQFAPGSFLNLIWKDAAFAFDRYRDADFFDNWRHTMDAPDDNTLTLKLIYWLDAGRW
ncbi:MAG: carbohydrate binding family 9 domain-containing protein [Saprospiraceae bacterium]|nr:carbohydrate binding family 9 domain-containing protein [Saprospiraceae bacterium]